MRTDKPVAEFKDIKFDGKTWDECNRQLKKWLSETAHKKIHFSDPTIDMQTMWVAKSGEILHTDFQTTIFIGAFVNLDALEEFIQIEFYKEGSNNGEWKRLMGLIPESITVINE